MATSTARLSIPVPQSTDPANVPSDMTNLADALDAGVAGKPYLGATVFNGPMAVGALPVSPIVGTFYTINSSPPYLLFYTGEATTGTGTAPSGYRLVGQAGTVTANITSNTPGNLVQAGSQPVWAALDHQHAMPPWGTAGQITVMAPSSSSSAGTNNGFARSDHAHAAGPLLTALAGYPSPFPTPSAAPFYMEAGSAGVTTDGSGKATVTYTTAFPNYVMSIVCTPTNSFTAATNVVIDASSIAPIGPGSTNVLKPNQFTVVVYNGTSPVTGSLVDFNWFAMGV